MEILTIETNNKRAAVGAVLPLLLRKRAIDIQIDISVLHIILRVNVSAQDVNTFTFVTGVMIRKMNILY